MIATDLYFKNRETESMLDKETVGRWIGWLELPLALYLKSNLKPSGSDWFQKSVIDHLRSNEMINKAKTSRDIKSLDVNALLDVFLVNWEGIRGKNNIPRSFKNTIHSMKDIRHKYLGHKGVILDINTTGYKDLDILIEFTDQIGADELKEKFKKERDKEIIRLSKDIRSKADSYLEPIESKEYEAEVLSVSAAETIHLIEKYLVHSCPNSYSYKKTEHIIFRTPPYGEMNTIYKIDKVMLVPKNYKNNLEYFDSQGLSLEEMERLRNYIDKNPFTKNDRFYLLSKWKKLPQNHRPTEYKNEAMYFSINQLMTGNNEEQ
jgi:hypothetical protein